MSTKQTAAVLLDDSNRGKEGKLTILHDFPIKEPSEVCTLFPLAH